MTDPGPPRSDQTDRRSVSTVTLLVTDVEDSTHLWESHPEAMTLANARHDQIIEDAIRSFNGSTSKSQWEGDSVVAIFKTASQASACALALQGKMSVEPWPEDLRMKLRIALYTGDAAVEGGTVSGPLLHRAVALRNMAEGGQILVSRITSELLRGGHPIPGIVLPWGSHRLRPEMPAEEVFQLSLLDPPSGVSTH